jgi:hypothetical protein
MRRHAGALIRRVLLDFGYLTRDADASDEPLAATATNAVVDNALIVTVRVYLPIRFDTLASLKVRHCILSIDIGFEVF